MTLGSALPKAMTCIIQPNRRGTKRPPAALHAVATEMATITAVVAAASLVMGGNLMINMFDVAVVGAGPGGATAALTLARRGLKVALLEKAALPRYKTCGGALVARGLRCSRRK